MNINQIPSQKTRNKHDAQRSRLPENSLHALALLGGWSGALIARYLFCHKTQKQPFVSLFWLTAAANIALTGYLWVSGSLNLG